MENEICENCSRAIGKLEEAFVYKGHIVCKECNSKLQHKPQETQPSQAKSQQAPSAPNFHPPNTLHKKSWLARYKTRCGTRSFAFQCSLLAWTALMIILLGILLKPVTKKELIYDYDVNPYNPREMAAWKAGNLCCPLGVWFIVAVPLGIAAIATFGRNKK